MLRVKNVFPLAALLAAITSPAYGQAIVTFNNHSNVAFTAQTDRRVYLDFVGGTPVIGTNYMAQLYYGVDAASLVASTALPARFRPSTTTLPGTWVGGNRTLPGFSYGDTITLQVRVWDGTSFASFEEAVLRGAIFGASAPFHYVAGTPGEPANAFAMENLRAFATDSRSPLVNQPPRFTRGPNVTRTEDSTLWILAAWARGIAPGPSSEIAQSVTFVVSNTAPELFTIQPAVSSSGDLFFQPATNEHGTAHVTLWLRDNGGTANGGRDSSDPQFFDVTITPVNDMPVAHAQAVAVNEDNTVAIALAGFDVDGDTLSFRPTASVLHGTTTYGNGIVYYTPSENYSGSDSFTFTAFDGQAESQSATVSINVRPVNDSPVARASIAPLFNLSIVVSNTLVLSLNGSDALVILDGSESSDIDNATIEHLWYDVNLETSLARGAVATNAFAMGPHAVSLIVSDGDLTSSATVSFEVISLADAINLLVVMLETSDLPRRAQRPLLVSLKSAAKSFEESQINAGTNQLLAFMHKLDAQLAGGNPELLNNLRTAAQAIIDALEE